MATSFPSEFISHLHPLLFTAGLGGETTPYQSDKEHDSQFNALITSLRRVLTARRAFAIWDQSRSAAHDFHSILVEKNIRFPPRKARTTLPGATAPTIGAHSPISPLSPNSPLFPDGLLAPIWIRKHRELVPAAFVLALRIYEPDPGEFADDPLNDPNSPRAQAERKADFDLIQEVIDRKKSCAERGIKLAVVLFTSRKMLDNQSLDIRLSMIRRQSGLDTRASLFVLSPVPMSEVQNFVASLKAELREAALDYYREHARRVRRKRSRSAPSIAKPIGGSTAAALSPQGWNVRSDYKMAVFAEFRQELEVALKHYQDSYDGLIDMFGSTVLLPPRTKRWAEAKVLADCISFKICKLYLYLQEPNRCLAQHHLHITRFTELCNGWGIGDETFEFWSWVSKQHRLFGDLIDIAVKSGYQLPPTNPVDPIGIQAASRPKSVATANPAHILQHAGFYYYLAGLCAVKRRDCYLAADSEEQTNPSVTTSPAVLHERKVVHADQIIDLYTKAYELFKSGSSNRMTLFLASQIALTHYQAGNHEMALKFHERIAKSYKKENNTAISNDVILQTAKEAIKTVQVETAAKSAFELLFSRADSLTDKDQQLLLSETLTMLKANSPTETSQPLVIDFAPDVSIWDCRAAFWSAHSNSSEKMPLQLQFRPVRSSSTQLTFNSIRVDLGDEQPSLIISHSTTPDQSLLHLGNIVDLSKISSHDLFIQSTVDTSESEDLELRKVILETRLHEWQIQISLTPATAKQWFLEKEGKLSEIPLSDKNHLVCSFRPRKLDIKLETSFAEGIHLDETAPVHITIINSDIQSVDASCDLILQPIAEMGTIIADALFIEPADIEGQAAYTLELGVLAPGVSVTRPIYLRAVTTPGDRTIDISLVAKPTDESGLAPQPTIVERTLSIPVTHSLHCDYAVRHAWAAPMTLQGDEWFDAAQMAISASMGSFGPLPIEILGIATEFGEFESQVRVLGSSLAEGDGQLPDVWHPTDTFALHYEVVVKRLSPEEETTATIPSGQLIVSWRRPDQDLAIPPAKTGIPLPQLKASSHVQQPRVLAHFSPTVSLRKPLEVTYTLYIPPSLSQTKLELSYHVDSTENFVFQGLRRRDRFTLSPGTTHLAKLSMVPVSKAGRCEIPLLKCFQHLPSPSKSVQVDMGGFNDDDDQDEEVTRELLVYEAGDARYIPDGVVPAPITVMVLPL